MHNFCDTAYKLALPYNVHDVIYMQVNAMTLCTVLTSGPGVPSSPGSPSGPGTPSAPLAPGGPGGPGGPRGP